MELGITTFVETTPDFLSDGKTPSHDERIRQVIAEMELADQVGLDIFGIGEHHRADYASSSPATILAAGAVVTENIRLTSAVTVLSSDDPVRVFQQFATVDAISNGRAEIMAGRGSFIESFPLFGQDLNDYHELYDEKLSLLLNIIEEEIVTWEGKHRPSIDQRGVYPRPVQDSLPVWIASGGTPDSVQRAARLGLPLALAIIGGSPLRFAPLAELYKRTAERYGHDSESLPIASHSHGFVAADDGTARDMFFPSTQYAMNVIGRERGWPPYTRETFDRACEPEGVLYVGSPETVAEKIIFLRKQVGVTRFFLHLPVGSMPHNDVMRSIELFGNEVAPIVREEVKKWEVEQGINLP